MRTKVKSKIDTSTFPVVGVGASAGGLESFIQLLSGMPVNTGMAFILIQHLDPTHPSMSVEILSRSTKLKVEEVKDGVKVKPNHVYVIPPNYNMEILDGVLNLFKRTTAPGQNMTIDFFLQSLAKSEKDRAVGIVLSGTGSDGTHGLKAIKDEGGLTLAQDPKSAKYAGMPESAIAAGVVDLVLPCENITKELTRIAAHPYLKAHEETDEPSDDLNQIFNLLRIHTKIDFTDYKHSTIKRRIQRRMVVHKSKSLQEYALYLETHEEEIKALYDDILINVTEFFRDSDSFKALTKHVFPKILKDRPPLSPIRIWVPGCASGEEVYSIAIALTELLLDSGKKNLVQIFATDISDQAIQNARLGTYSDSVTHKISKDRLKRFFEKIEGGYKIHKDIRDMCLFSKHDMTVDPPFAKLDFISCRNVLIYFNQELQKRVIPIFHYALNVGGFLWLGKAENPSDFSKYFSQIDKTHKIYSKTNIALPMGPPLRMRSARGFLEINKPLQLASKVKHDFKTEADKIIISQYTPPSVVVNGDMEILQFRGRTVPFLEPAPGQASLNLLKMARPELLAALRATVQSARKENKVARKKSVHFVLDGHRHTVDIEVLPINPRDPPRDRALLIIFKESDSPEKEAKDKKGRGPSERKISELLNELTETKDYQQTLIEKYEATQEELTSANEELQSTNEELQSTNEEIETAQEELQSTNEELITVNDELQMRNNELTILSSDLNNLLTSVEIPVLIVSADKRIRRFSLKARNAFNLIPTDIGRPLHHIKPNFSLDLDTLVNEVTESLNLREVEVQDNNGAWLRVQIRPYRTVEDKIDGVVIALIDIDALKKREQSTRDEIEYLTSILETVPMPLAVISQELQMKASHLPTTKSNVTCHAWD